MKHFWPKALRDFKNFLWRAWTCVGLRRPTDLQYFLADVLQYGVDEDGRPVPEVEGGKKNNRDVVVLCFRGFGKSWIASAFGCWRLGCNIDRKFLCTSGSSKKARQNTNFMKQLFGVVPELIPLMPTADDRSASEEFDIAGCRPAQAPSVLSLGITSNLVNGARCDDYVADDCETKKNSQTASMRERILDVVREFGGGIQRSGDEIEDPTGVFLGTPQLEESLYFELEEMGYSVVIIPARYPTAAQRKIYGNRLASILRDRLDADPSIAGKPTEPDRFGEETLRKREAKYGKLGWLLQFMLLPSLSTEDRYPLKINDLTVMDLDKDLAPEKVFWSADDKHRILDRELPCVGFRRDWWHKPVDLHGRWVPYTKKVMGIDPSAGGADELGYTVIGVLNSQIFLLETGGYKKGSEDATFTALAEIAKEWGVDTVVAEENLGAGMWGKLFRPFLRKVHPECGFLEETVGGQKEKRIIDRLDPACDAHRVIVNRSAIIKDFESAQKYEVGALECQLFYQLSRITPDRDCLKFDDRLESFAIAVHHVEEQMGRDYEEQMDLRKKEEMSTMLENWANNLDAVLEPNNPNPMSQESTWLEQ